MYGEYEKGLDDGRILTYKSCLTFIETYHDAGKGMCEFDYRELRELLAGLLRQAERSKAEKEAM